MEKKFDALTIVEPYAWQKTVLDLVKLKPHPRKIYWIWDSKGCAGKTTLAKHLCLTKNAVYLTGKGSDIKFGVIKHLEKHNTLDIAIFYYPRTCEEYVSYQSLEEIKDGIFFSGKYESGMCIYDTPHVIVLANFSPDTKKLSEDRWDISELPGV